MLNKFNMCRDSELCFSPVTAEGAGITEACSQLDQEATILILISEKSANTESCQFLFSVKQLK